jgi:hypothetical protein
MRRVFLLGVAIAVDFLRAVATDFANSNNRRFVAAMRKIVVA